MDGRPWHRERPRSSEFSKLQHICSFEWHILAIWTGRFSPDTSGFLGVCTIHSAKSSKSVTFSVVEEGREDGVFLYPWLLG